MLGNRLEVLRGDRASQHSIRIDAQWRICFRRKKDEPCNVEIVDYHRGKVETMTARNGMSPVHPGEVLRDGLKGLGLSAGIAGVENTSQHLVSGGLPGHDAQAPGFLRSSFNVNSA